MAPNASRKGRGWVSNSFLCDLTRDSSCLVCEASRKADIFISGKNVTFAQEITIPCASEKIRRRSVLFLHSCRQHLENRSKSLSYLVQRLILSSSYQSLGLLKLVKPLCCHSPCMPTESMNQLGGAGGQDANNIKAAMLFETLRGSSSIFSSPIRYRARGRFRSEQIQPIKRSV